jgi:hypothetical protein
MRSVFVIASLLLVLALVAQLVRRRCFTRGSDAFRCRARLCAKRSVLWPRLRARWTSRRLWARWERDELVVRRGMLLMRTVRLPARVRGDGIYLLTCLDVTKLGSRPIAIELEISDGSWIELAAKSSARLGLVGPYVGAALHGLPRAPAPRRQIPGAGS